MRHEQKVLGRYGVAALTSIGSADQLPAMTQSAEPLRAMLSFPEGRRYPDFEAAGDQVSSYTIPTLVTGALPTTAAANAPAQQAGQTGFGGFSGLFPWIAGGVLLLAGAGYLMLRRRRDDEDDDDEEVVEEA